MNVKTFQGPSIGEALAKVKQQLGPKAMILHTRSFKTGGMMGLGARTVVEITAGVDVNVQARKKTAPAAASASRSRSNDSGAFESQSSGTATAVEEPGSRHPLRVVYPTAKSNVTKSAQPSRMQESSGPATMNLSTRELAATVLKEPSFELRNELSSLRSMVESLLQRSSNTGGRRTDLPQQLGQMYMKLIEQQVSEEIAIRVVDDVKAELTLRSVVEPGHGPGPADAEARADAAGEFDRCGGAVLRRAWDAEASV